MLPGTIAAIVIGSIAGALLLLWICKGCCMCIGLCWVIGGEDWYCRKFGRRGGGEGRVEEGRVEEGDVESLGGRTVC